MRDLVVREGLQTMARDAAKLFRELIAAGEEIPYEVREPGNGSPLCRYQPLTERFVRQHASALRELDSFGAACAALEASDLAAPYLEQFGVSVPPEPRPRAELAAIVFLCRLWMDSTDLSLDRERLAAAVAEFEAGGEAREDEVDVIVPLRGFQMPVTRLELANVTIVRADTVEVPPEARSGEVMGASPWEPAFLAVARVEAPSGAEDASDARAADGTDARAPDGTDAFRRLIATLRLFKAGGVGLGPHAWVAAASNRWRRISTGAGRPRPGGYRLTEAELGELVAFSRALASRDTPFGRLQSDRRRSTVALGRAISRFEAGLERAVVLEALSDNLLALRFLLEGGGPADLGLAMRVAALCAEPERRGEVKAVLQRAEGLERELWSGEPQSDGTVPAETAMRLEELARAILKDAACGHLGGDLRTTADEILLAEGLAVGDGAGAPRGETAEWGVAKAAAEAEAAREPEPGREPELTGELEPAFAPTSEPVPFEPRIEVVKGPRYERRKEDLASELEEDQMTLNDIAHDIAQPIAVRREEPPTGVLEAVPEPDPLGAAAEADQPEPERPDESPVLRLIEEARSERRQRAGRLEGLFPRPETEWNVRELSYDRRRRADVSKVS